MSAKTARRELRPAPNTTRSAGAVVPMRLMPAANSGARSPLSAASAASLRIADILILIMIEEDPSRRVSKDTRHALTVTLVKPGRGACWNVQKLYDAKDLDFRLKPGAAAVDRGVALPNITDGFAGRAPDLGAIELGQATKHYGPRP